MITMAKTTEAEWLKAILIACSKAMRNNHIDEIRELDATIGDGDLGITISKGAAAVIEALENCQDKDVGKVLKKTGMAFMEANPSTFAVLGGTAFMYAGKVVSGKEEIEINDLPKIVNSAIRGIQKRGKAKTGEKTMLDPLNKVVETLEANRDSYETIDQAFDDIVKAAKAGMLGTKDMLAKRGRAKAFGKRTIGEIDPGSKVVYFFFKELNHLLKNEE